MRQTMKVLPFALLFAVAACAQYQNKESMGRDYGDAVHHNLSVHVIDPAPNLEGKEIPDMNGNRAAGALQRYKTGTELEPETIDTTSIN
jgi:type IV pilus biogenesis protein CpaD/CtpE